MNNPDVLDVYSKLNDDWNKKLITVDVPKNFHTTQEAEFIKMLCGEPCDLLPTIEDGIRSQKILDAILKSSKNNSWIEIL